MSTSARFRWSAFAMIVAGGLGGLLLMQQPAESFQTPRPQKWDYTSVSVEANGLPAKLTELGNDGWLVFSIERSEMKVSPENPPRIVVETYEVSARKTRR